MFAAPRAVGRHGFPRRWLKGVNTVRYSSLQASIKLSSVPAPHSGSIAVLSLNRPKARNALSRQLLSELSGVIEGLHAEGGKGSTRALILASESDDAFCAGADLKERLTFTPEEHVTQAFLSNLRSTFTRLSTLPIPTISAVSSTAFGGGLEIALCTNFRVMSSNAVVGLPETRLAIVPGAGGTFRLPALIGESRARDLILTGRRVTGPEAYFLGLCDRLVEVPEGEEKQAGVARGLVMAQAVEMANVICEGGPVAIRAAMQALAGWEQGEPSENAAYELVLPTQDRTEALKAFGSPPCTPPSTQHEHSMSNNIFIKTGRQAIASPRGFPGPLRRWLSTSDTAPPPQADLAAGANEPRQVAARQPRLDLPGTSDAPHDADTELGSTPPSIERARDPSLDSEAAFSTRSAASRNGVLYYLWDDRESLHAWETYWSEDQQPINRTGDARRREEIHELWREAHGYTGQLRTWHAICARRRTLLRTGVTREDLRSAISAANPDGGATQSSYTVRPGIQSNLPQAPVEASARDYDDRETLHIWEICYDEDLRATRREPATARNTLVNLHNKWCVAQGYIGAPRTWDGIKQRMQDVRDAGETKATLIARVQAAAERAEATESASTSVASSGSASTARSSRRSVSRRRDYDDRETLHIWEMYCYDDGEYISRAPGLKVLHADAHNAWCKAQGYVGISRSWQGMRKRITAFRAAGGTKAELIASVRAQDTTRATTGEIRWPPRHDVTRGEQSRAAARHQPSYDLSGNTDGANDRDEHAADYIDMDDGPRQPPRRTHSSKTNAQDTPQAAPEGLKTAQQSPQSSLEDTKDIATLSSVVQALHTLVDHAQHKKGMSRADIEAGLAEGLDDYVKKASKRNPAFAQEWQNLQLSRAKANGDGGLQAGKQDAEKMEEQAVAHQRAVEEEQAAAEADAEAERKAIDHEDPPWYTNFTAHSGVTVC
ncbi:hypothetical protein LTR53_002125 [Teratosphaeriaceae sp. CCFEE 6253]|nr:hypothetical protein LTR53_002125 [Teratosphaeriaceae sp. CCFEE 6253]